MAFEDSPSGLKAAIRAGLPTVGMLTGHPEDALRDLGACLVVRNYNELMYQLGIKKVVSCQGV